MFKVNIMWLFVLSIAATFVILLLHGSIFTHCLEPENLLLKFDLAMLTPFQSCLALSALISFCIMFFGPLLVTIILFSIYVLIFNKPPTFSKYVLWIAWLIAVFFVAYELTFVLPF